MPITPLKQARLNLTRQHPTQAEIAALAGIDASYYSRLEAGATTASAELAQRLAEVLKTPVDQLFTPASYAVAACEEAA